MLTSLRALTIMQIPVGSGRTIVNQTHLVMGIGDLHTVLAKGTPDAQVKRRFQGTLILLRVVDPDPKLELDAAVGETQHPGVWRVGPAQHPRFAMRNLDDD